MKYSAYSENMEFHFTSEGKEVSPETNPVSPVLQHFQDFDGRMSSSCEIDEDEAFTDTTHCPFCDSPVTEEANRCGHCGSTLNIAMYQRG